MSETTKQTILKIIKDNKVVARKQWGQNFLIDDRILKQIVDASNINEDTVVIEIGPGLGSLTQYLLDQAKVVIAYEIDTQMIDILNQRFYKHPKLKLIHDDFLNRNIDEDIKSLVDTGDVVLIANLPYYITTPILFKCLEESAKIKRYIVMMQQEVAKRFTASVNTKDYNALSVAMQFRTQTNYLFKVPRHVFIPEPNVDSAVISLDINSDVQLNDKLTQFFFSFIKHAFKQRRKTLVNNLHVAFDMDKPMIERVLENQGYPKRCRAESLSVDDLCRLSAIFYDIMNK